MTDGAFSFAHRMELAVVRHGRTAWNADGRFQGQTDVALDDVGRAQAAALAEVLRDDVFDVALASDLSRARETATIVLGARDVALDLDPRLREMRFGAWEGLAWPQIVARYPHLADESALKPRFSTPEGGEDFDGVCARVAAAFAALDARAFDGAAVLLVTHAGVLHAMLRVVLGESAALALAVRFSPASVTRFAVGPSGNRLLSLNCVPSYDVPA